MSQPPVNPDQPPDQPSYGEQPPYPPAPAYPPPSQWQAPEPYPGQPVSGGPPAAPSSGPPGSPMSPTAPLPPVPSAPPYQQQYPGQAPPSYQPYQGGQPYQPGQAAPPTGYPPAQPYQPGQPYPGQPYGGTAYPGGAPAPAKSSNRTLIIVFVVIGALLVLCCVGVVGLFAYRASQVTASDSSNDDPGFVMPSFNPPGPGGGGTGPTASGANANQPLGKVITFSDTGGTWTVSVTTRTWSDANCGPSAGFFPPPHGKLLIVDVVFEVTKGKASINPFYFDYIDSAGKRGDYSILSGCDEPSFQADNDLPAGTKRTGKIAFDITIGQTGVIQYENLFGDDAASWKITP